MSNSSPLPRHIHVIGICGVATSALAVAFHKKGVKVTGSDKGFFPPVSTELEKQGIIFYAGWHPEKIEESGRPDLIICGAGGTSLSNPEMVYAKEQNIPLMSFAQALGAYIVQKNSIVATGTWGKTTISCLLSYIMIEAGMDPSYFTGGISLSHDTGAIGNSDWSVVEGDEYQAAIWDKRPKFDYYKPSHLILTKVSWDHADLYPTEESYFDAFRKLIASLPENGLILACADDDGVLQILSDTSTTARVVRYGREPEEPEAEAPHYWYANVRQSKKGISFDIHCDEEVWNVGSPMLGGFNAENITACFAMAHEIGIEPEKILAGIEGFKGIKRRFEKRFEGEVTVLDCHAPTPEKAASILTSIREIYDQQIIAVFEPNIGSREREAIPQYSDAFDAADMVVIPRLTKLKVAEGAAEQPMEGDELAQVVSQTNKNCSYIEDDTKLVDLLISSAKKDDVIVFLGSHGFRGMIEETIGKVK